MPVEKRPIIGVMGSGSKEWIELAEPLGCWLAGIGVHLLTGGGAGVMTSVSRAFAAVQNRKGQILGIIPGDFDGGKIVYKIGYPHPWVEIPIYTHLPLSGIEGKEPLSRNHINILSSDAIVALPGGAGTQSEIELAVHYGKPIICFTSSIDLNSSGIRSTDSLDEVKRFVVEVLKSLEKL
ncbi:molybdenum cofactor carrier protein [candidate division KSB1 bacterium]|nr:molybdenum cofactor carrier protein [candidate division KSB1 bacterium]